MNHAPSKFGQPSPLRHSRCSTHPRSLLALLACGLSCGPLLADPVPHITVKVTVDSSTDYKKITNSNERSRKQTRQLNVSLGNNDKDLPANLTVKWAIYSHTLKDHKLTTSGHGTEIAKVEPFKTVTVNSAKVTIEGTPEHSVITTKNSGRGKGNAQVNAKRNPATGAEYYGYAVAVYAGSTLVEEIASQPSIKLDK